MAPFSSGLNAVFADATGSKEADSASENVSMSWYGSSENSQPTTDQVAAAAGENLSKDFSSAALTEIYGHRERVRQRMREQLASDGPVGKLETSIEKPAVSAPSTGSWIPDSKIAASSEQGFGKGSANQGSLEFNSLFRPQPPADLSFSQLKQLGQPNGVVSLWMDTNRPGLLKQFNSDACSLQIGSQPDGTVFKILTSPEGNRWSMTAKGSATVETLADSSGQILFKNSTRAAITG